MNERRALSRLWWKELRQLLPLVTVLPVAIGLFLLIVWLLGGQPPNSFPFGWAAIVPAAPGLFAAGVGALSVGIEKEQCTLGWLSSLPIQRRRIVRVKLAAALLALLALWVLGGLWLSLASQLGGALPAPELAWVTWPLHTLFLLLAGFALAWWARSPLTAMLWVVPVATLPLLLAQLVDGVIRWDSRIWSDPNPASLIVSQSVLILLAGWLAHRLGVRGLSAERVRGQRLTLGSLGFDGDQPPSGRVFRDDIQSRFAALVWQFRSQSSSALIGILCLLTFAVIGFGTTEFALAPPGLGIFALIATVLGVSWLGTSVFLGDVSNGRIRFLADRGISPGEIWWTRHATPAALLATFVFAILTLQTLSHLRSFQSNQRGEASFAEGWPLMLTVVLLIYFVSQWIAQAMPSPIMAGISAPIASLLTFAYGSLVLFQFGTPLWLGWMVLLIPLMATRLMTRRWMDRQLGIGFWQRHFAFAMAFFLLPLLPYLAILATQPGMPRSIARELRAANTATPPRTGTGTEPLVLRRESWVSQPSWLGGDPGDDWEEITVPEPVDVTAIPSIATAWSDDMDWIGEQLGSRNVTLDSGGLQVMRYLSGIASLTRAKLDRDGESADNGVTAEELAIASRLYSESIRLMSRISVLARSSGRLVDQDLADLIEIWLLSECFRESTRQRLGEPLYQQVVARLAARSERQEARRQAVANSWVKFEWDRQSAGRIPPTEVGGFTLSNSLLTRAPGGSSVFNRRIGHAFAELWRWAEAGAAGTRPERSLVISWTWGGRPPSARADDVRSFSHTGFDDWPRPAQHWFAGWEFQAEELARTGNPPTTSQSPPLE